MTQPKVNIFIDMKGENNQRLLVDGSLSLLRELWATGQPAEPLMGEVDPSSPKNDNRIGTKAQKHAPAQEAIHG